MTSEIYCGNNKLDPRAKNAGTPRQCFKKGFGNGYHNAKPDPSFAGPYKPLMPNKLYCGARPPRGKVRATLGQCSQLGWGAGMRKRVSEMSEDDLKSGFTGLYGGKKPTTKSTTPNSHMYVIGWVVFNILIAIIMFPILYYLKPSYVTKLDDKGNRTIVWSRFFVVYISLLVLINMGLFLRINPWIYFII